MINVLMAAPYNPNGRYLGGISSIANAVFNNKSKFLHKGIEIAKFETCLISRKSAQNHLNLQNISNFIKVYRTLGETLKKKKYDVLYFHSSVGLALLKDLICIKKAKKAGVTTILHIHFADYERIVSSNAFIEKRIVKYMKLYVDKLVFLSAKTRDVFFKKGFEAHKCFVLYNFSLFNFPIETIQRKASKKKDKVSLLFVGSIDQRKGIFDLLEIFEKVGTSCQLNVCGIPIDSKSESMFLNAIKINPSVNYMGFVNGEAKEKIYLESDVLVLPSYAEGLPVVILEAFSAGCAVIATKVGANSEIVHPENGILIDPGNTNELLRAIRNYTDHEKLSATQMKNYLYSVNFSLDSFISNLSDIILGANK